MASLAETNELRRQVQDLVTLGVRDLTTLLRTLRGENPAEVAGLLAEMLSPLADPYAAQIGELSADFYMADRATQGVTTAMQPPAPVLPEPDRLAALARWGVGPLFLETPDHSLVASRLAGGLTGILGDVQRDTTIRFAEEDPAEVRYQRMPQAGCCAFCAMLASRGAVYSSEAAATGVVGRGVPVSKTTGRRGGQGKGIRARGSRGMGEKFHDFCRCVGVAVHAGRRQQMDARAEEYFEAYAEARAKVDERVDYNFLHYMDEAGNRHVDSEWIDEDGSVITQPERILIAEMRKILATN